MTHTEMPNTHSMSYEEREHLKNMPTDESSLKALPHLIAHWMRNENINFTLYASNWCVANEYGTEAMRQHWPLKNARILADGATDWPQNASEIE